MIYNLSYYFCYLNKIKVLPICVMNCLENVRRALYVIAINIYYITYKQYYINRI